MTARTWTCPSPPSLGRVDEAESGRIADRPEFRKMIDAASQPNAPFREILIRQTQ